MSKQYIEIFKKKTNDSTCQSALVKNLVTNSSGSTTILVKRTNKIITSNLIIKTNKEGLEQAKVVVENNQDIQIGDYIIWEELTFLLTEQEHNVLLDDNIKKFIARKCNIQFIYNNIYYDGIFIGSSASKVSLTLDGTENMTKLLSMNNNSVLIFSNINIPKFDSFLINQTQWKILEWDNITAPGIIYATVTEIPVSIVQRELDPSPVIKYYSGLEYSFETEDYYFSSNINLKVSKFKNEIKIIMPYNVLNIEFDTKKNGQIIHHNIILEV